MAAPSQHKTAVQYLPVMQQQFGSLIFFFWFFWRWGGGGVSLPPENTNFFLCSPPPELVHCATVFGLNTHTAPGLQVRIVLFVFAFSGNKCVQARTATYKVSR